MTSIESFAVLANMLIIGGIGGFFTGYVLKRTVKILLIGLGILGFLLAFLGFMGTINVNYDGLAAGITNLVSPQQLSIIIQGIATYLPLVASFVVGFVLGIGKK